MVWCDFGERWWGVGAALGGVTEGVARVKGTASGWVSEVRGHAWDGVKRFAFLVGGWNAFHQGPGVGVARVGEEFPGRGALDDPTSIHDIHNIAGLVDHSEVVGDENNGGAQGLLTVFDEVEHLFLHRDIESGGGFVADEQFGSGDESHGNHHALAHATGKFVGVGVNPLFRLRYSDLGQGVDGFMQRGFPFNFFMDLQGLGELGGDFEKRIQGGHRVLENHRDPFSPDTAELAVGGLQEIRAIEDRLAGVNFSWRLRDESNQGVTGNGFSRPRLTDDSDSLSFFNRKRNIFDGVNHTVAGVESGSEVLDVEEWHGGAGVGKSGVRSQALGSYHLMVRME